MKKEQTFLKEASEDIFVYLRNGDYKKEVKNLMIFHLQNQNIKTLKINILIYNSVTWLYQIAEKN